VDGPGAPRFAVRALCRQIAIHCDTEEKARDLQAAIAERLRSLGLELHPDKTKIVFCKDTRRRGDFEHTSFDFLGYTFRWRTVLGKKGLFTGFNPAISANATKAVNKKIRDWHLKRRNGTDLSSLASEINPQVRGLINYYGAFYRSRSRRASTNICIGGPRRSSNDYEAGPMGPGRG
jgi:RNA-directed DNA polymerase